MNNPFEALKATAVIGKPLPKNFEYATEYAVTSPTGRMGALLKNIDTGIYCIVCDGIQYSCSQDWAKEICGIKKIPLKQWAIAHGIQPATARQKAIRGTLSAEKIGRDWFIYEDVPNTDSRIKTGKFINWRK